MPSSTYSTSCEVSPAESSPESIAFHHGSSDTDKVFVPEAEDRGLFTVDDDPPAPSYSERTETYYYPPPPEDPISPLEVDKNVPVQVMEVEKETVPEDQEPRSPRKRIWRWVVLVASILVVIGLSIGLGMGLTIGQSDRVASGPGSAGTNTTGTASKIASIQANSSITAVQSDLGDRFVFFQAEDDTIRWAIYTNATSEWSSIYTLNNSITPRKSTPMAAYVQPGSNVAAQSLIELVYISDNSSIVEVEISPTASVRSDIATDSRPLIAATDAAYLTITAALRPGLNTTLDIFMMFRTSSSIGVWQKETDRTSWKFGTPWQDITSDLMDSLDGDAICEPFTANAYFSTTAADGQPDTLAQFVASSCSQASPRVLSNVWNRLYNNFSTTTWPTYTFDNTTTTSNTQNSPSITKSDWVVVQGSSEWYFVDAIKGLSAFSFQNTVLPQPVLKDTFPYPHLSSLRYSWGLNSSYLYNQISGTTFAEHVYDTTKKAWNSTVVDVTKITPATS